MPARSLSSVVVLNDLAVSLDSCLGEKGILARPVKMVSTTLHLHHTGIHPMIFFINYQMPSVPGEVVVVKLTKI